MSPIKSK
jgi:hypothetical protein